MKFFSMKLLSNFSKNNPPSSSVYFRFKFKLIKAWMVCMGFEPRVAGWKAQTNPLSYGGNPSFIRVFVVPKCFNTYFIEKSSIILGHNISRAFHILLLHHLGA